MAKRKRSTQEHQQPYDNALKSLFEGQEAEILPYFLPESVYLETLTIEVMRTLLRVDRVYKVLYKGQEHIVHFEFEAGSDSAMAARLLDYHAYFYYKYKLPVISIIVYPFRTTMASSPLEEMSLGKSILTFHFYVFPLWMLDAKKYVEEHSIALYALLPAMEGANAALLNEAIQYMIEYYREDEAKLVRELRWMGIMLRRADIVPLEEKQMIERRLSMYDDLMEKDPKMQKIRAESKAMGEAIGEAKGEAKGEARTLRMVILTIVRQRFPALAEFAKVQVKQVSKPEELLVLFERINMAHDEQEAYALLIGVSARLAR